MSEQREMTLDEWVNRLPDFHLANKEYQQLQQQIAELTATVGGYKSGDIVPIPKNSDTAQMMANLAIDWLKHNAPDKLSDIVKERDELVATVKRLLEFDMTPEEFHHISNSERYKQNLNHVKREAWIKGYQSTGIYHGGNTEYMSIVSLANQRYPSGKDGE